MVKIYMNMKNSVIKTIVQLGLIVVPVISAVAADCTRNTTPTGDCCGWQVTVPSHEKSFILESESCDSCNSGICVYRLSTMEESSAKFPEVDVTWTPPASDPNCTCDSDGISCEGTACETKTESSLVRTFENCGSSS